MPTPANPETDGKKTKKRFKFSVTVLIKHLLQNRSKMSSGYGTPYGEAGQSQNAKDAKQLDKVTTPTQFQDPNGFFHTTIFSDLHTKLCN